MVTSQKKSLQEAGYFVEPDLFSTAEVHALLALESLRGSAAGLRNLFECTPEIRKLVTSEILRNLVEDILGGPSFAIKAIFFDKSPLTNWKVMWHQDLTIAVKEKKEAAGYGPWSIKDQITHVQPPLPVLEQMLTVRIHLDFCGVENGPLRVLPGSHRCGKMSADQISAWRSEHAECTCVVPTGGAVIMSPLLLHASSKSVSPSHRRVLHLEFAAIELNGLKWRDKIPLRT